MADLLADINVQGHVDILRLVLESSRWHEFWKDLACSIFTFAEVGLERKARDVEVWRLCQERGLILVTGNRNQDGEDSLEATIQREGTPQSLPVFTLTDPEHIRRSAEYADRAVSKLLEHLYALEQRRGFGRIYLP